MRAIRGKLSMSVWGVILLATALYVLYVYMVPEATPAKAGPQKPAQSVSAGQEPEPYQASGARTAERELKADSDVNVAKPGEAPKEDEQGYDCYSMGNGVCGNDPAPQYSYEDGTHSYAKPAHNRAVVTGDDVNMRDGSGAVNGTLDQGFTFDAVCTSGGYVQGSHGNLVSSQYVEVGPLPTC